jgi:hypothetical protein
MKKVNYILLMIVFSLSLFSCSSNESEIIEPEPISMALSVLVEGDLSNSPTVSYNNANGDLITESLTGNWSKTLIILKPYTVLLEASVTNGGGSVEIKAIVTQDGSTLVDLSQRRAGTFFDFDLAVSHEL